MKKFIGIKDIEQNELYIDDTVEVKFKRHNKLEKGTIISKSHQFSKLYFIQCTNYLLPLNENFIQSLQIRKIFQEEAEEETASRQI